MGKTHVLTTTFNDQSNAYFIIIEYNLKIMEYLVKCYE